MQLNSDGTRRITYGEVAESLALTLEAIHDGGFRDARLHWAAWTSYNDVEARAELASYHMDRCAAATRAFNSAFANWHASILLERHSEPERWEEVERAHERLRAALEDLHADFPDR
jgi:hypothetical protein